MTTPMTRKTSSKRRMTVPFVAAAILLTTAAFGVRPMIAGLATRYTKEPIGLRKPLQEFRMESLRTFRVAREGHGLHEGQDDVETPDLMWHALECDRDGVGDDVAYAALFVTYYSDPRANIPHTPDVCYAQVGAAINSISRTTIEFSDTDDLEPVTAQIIDLESGGIQAAVIYLLYSNGTAYADRQRARFAMGWPGDRRVYFSKIEVVVPCRRGIQFEEAAAIGRRLLRESIPELLSEHLPRRQDVQ